VKRIRLLSFVIPICLLLVVTGIYLFSRREPLFLLKNIKIKGASQLTESEVLKRIYPALKESVVTTDMGKVREMIANHPFVKDVRVKRVFPFSILLDIKERTPSAIWIGGKGDLSVLDEDGQSYRSLEKGDVRGLFVIAAPEKNEARSIFSAVSSWERQGIVKRESISEIAYDKGNVTLFCMDDGVEIVLGKEDQGPRLKRALAVLEDAKKRGLIIRCIDARFESGAIVKERTS
jgi:cell division protein FtsQ